MRRLETDEVRSMPVPVPPPPVPPPVPADEVLRIDLKDETLQVDGNFALMRTGRIEFSVEKSTRSLLGTITSGEGLLQTFRGTGSVWLAPTQEVYQRLQAGGMASLGLRVFAELISPGLSWRRELTRWNSATLTPNTQT